MSPRSREVRRQMERDERRALRSGKWPAWTRTPLPTGLPSDGWLADVREAWGNSVFAVLVRPLKTPDGEVLHLAIRTVTNLEPPWRDMQRIKSELFGAERIAVQVYPAETRVIDEADMYHLWVLPSGNVVGFGLHPDDEGCF